MIRKTPRILLIIFSFFLLDLIKPFGYFLSVEFLFLGFIVVVSRESLSTSLATAFLCAILRDFFVFRGPALAVFEFPFLCLFIHYLRSHRLTLPRQKHVFIAKTLIISISLFVHILVNSIYIRSILGFQSFQFFIQSISVYYLIDYLLGLKVNLAFRETFL